MVTFIRCQGCGGRKCCRDCLATLELAQRVPGDRLKVVQEYTVLQLLAACSLGREGHLNHALPTTCAGCGCSTPKHSHENQDVLKGTRMPGYSREGASLWCMNARLSVAAAPARSGRAAAEWSIGDHCLCTALGGLGFKYKT